jgi:outer membrane lipoprotein-sorting protein
VALHTYWASARSGRDNVHLRGRVRAPRGDNFTAISPGSEFVPIEIWKQSGAQPKWRVEKEARVAVMDGQSTLLYLKGMNMAYKIPQPSPSAFDTDWLQELANSERTLTNVIRNARAKGWKVETTKEIGARGREQTVVTIQTQSGLADNDFLKNKSMDTSDTRRVYHFDARSKHLAAAQIYLVDGADEPLIFETSQIDYNQAINPAVFHFDLPSNVNWYQEPQKLPDNQKYASLTAKEAARAFFEACAREDWSEAEKFDSALTSDAKKFLGGLVVVNVGEPFTAKPYGGQFVPYEIKFPPQQLNLRVSNANPAKRCVITGVYDDQLRLQQELKWVTPPEILTNNDTYARLSPAEAVKAYGDAQSRLDWDEMRKFTTESDVKDTENQVEMMKKAGLDPLKAMPVIQVGEAVWSAKESAWFVKCQALQIKRWNLALRNDNPAGRWQVDGGL